MIADTEKNDVETCTAVSVKEVCALLGYATNAGIGKEKVAALYEEIQKPDSDMDLTRVALLYCELTEQTKPVTGRTVTDSSASAHTRLGRISVVTGLFFTFAFGNYIAISWLGDLPDGEGISPWLELMAHTWDAMTPFFWGGLGSCVYLIKKVDDAASAHQYENHQLKGWVTRILIGGLLGSVTMIVCSPFIFSELTLPITPHVIAFVTGLSSKTVYSIFEGIVDRYARVVQP